MEKQDGGTNDETRPITARVLPNCYASLALLRAGKARPIWIFAAQGFCINRATLFVTAINPQRMREGQAVSWLG